jgi:hypothetical protein
MVICGSTRGPSWHLVLAFILGFFLSHFVDVAFQIKDLVKGLETNGIVILNGYRNSVGNPCAACDCGKTSFSDATAFENAAVPANSGFSQIVATAYKRCIIEMKSEQPRKELDLKEWKRNGMAGDGGLNNKDRKLLGILYHKASSVFEYGLGESTYIANHVGVERYAGIDSDPVWVGMARDKVSPHYRFYLGDIGPTVEWGYPKDNNKIPKQVLDYQLQPLIVEPKPFDVYMVDGRWRLACMLASFLHASARGGDPAKTIVCIHDCNTMNEAHLDRSVYHTADELLELVDHSQNKLCVYQRKPGTTDEQLRDMWFEKVDIITRRRLSRQISTASTNMTSFDVIVDAAFGRAIGKTSSGPKKVFDIGYWETSGLQTKGGLTREDRILLGQIYYNASSVFEYGLGESTYIANHVGVERYAGIDSDPVWVGMARDKVSPHYRFYLGDIGPTVEWGYPKDRNQFPKQVLDYQLQPLIVEPKPFDVYMVDGRWRLACMLASFLHASARGGDPTKTIVCVHDCDKDTAALITGRASYKTADHLLELVNHSNSRLCMYKRKPGTTDAQLQELWHEHMDVMSRRL